MPTLTLPGDVCSTLRHRTYQASFTQDADGPADSGAGQLKFLHQLALGGDALARLVLPRLDAPGEDLRELAVRGDWPCGIDAGHDSTLSDLRQRRSYRYVVACMKLYEVRWAA